MDTGEIYHNSGEWNGHWRDIPQQWTFRTEWTLERYTTTVDIQNVMDTGDIPQQWTFRMEWTLEIYHNSGHSEWNGHWKAGSNSYPDTAISVSCDDSRGVLREVTAENCHLIIMRQGSSAVATRSVPHLQA